MPTATETLPPASGRCRPTTGPASPSASSRLRPIRGTWIGGAGSIPTLSRIRARSTRSRWARPATSPAVTVSIAGSRLSCRPAQVPLPVPVMAGPNYWWGGKADQTNSMMTTAAPIAIPAGGASLSFDWSTTSKTVGLPVGAGLGGWHHLEDPDQPQYPCTHDPGWIGGLYGFPEDLCAAGIGGFTDYNANWPGPGVRRPSTWPRSPARAFSCASGT